MNIVDGRGKRGKIHTWFPVQGIKFAKSGTFVMGWRVDSYLTEP